MILLTRLNKKPFFVNSDLIKFVEQSPDTLVTMTTGEKIVVLEKPQEVLDRIIAFRRSVLAALPLAWDTSALHASIPQSTETDPKEPSR